MLQPEVALFADDRLLDTHNFSHHKKAENLASSKTDYHCQIKKTLFIIKSGNSVARSNP